MKNITLKFILLTLIVMFSFQVAHADPKENTTNNSNDNAASQGNVYCNPINVNSGEFEYGDVYGYECTIGLAVELLKQFITNRNLDPQPLPGLGCAKNKQCGSD